MAEGQLSQEEIDALMEGTSPFNFGTGTPEEKKEKEKEQTDYASVISTEPEKKKDIIEKEKKTKKKTGKDVDIKSATNSNMELLLDVDMTLTVELGRTKRSVKEVLSYGEGSIVELEKLSGEPVDVLVNGRLVARGEVVVIDESYGVKITELIDPYDRFI